MAVPLATTSITLTGRRPQAAIDPDAEGYDGPALPLSNLATDVPACISGPTNIREGDSEREMWELRCDPIPGIGINRFDIVTDETTGDVYEVDWVAESKVTMFGLDHIHARLFIHKGLPGGNLA